MLKISGDLFTRKVRPDRAIGHQQSNTVTTWHDTCSVYVSFPVGFGAEPGRQTHILAHLYVLKKHLVSK